MLNGFIDKQRRRDLISFNPIGTDRPTLLIPQSGGIYWWHLMFNNKIIYHSVAEEDFADEPRRSRTDVNEHFRRHNVRVLSFLLVLSASMNIFLGFMTFVHNNAVEETVQSPGTYTTGFGTEFAPATHAITLEERKASGALRYSSTTNSVERLHDIHAPQYFGNPSPEIDAAWHDLMIGEFFALSEDEAQPYLEQPPPSGGSLVRMPQTSRYHMELGVFHSLHCVNAIRKALEPDYYSHDGGHGHSGGLPENWKREHIDHCLENVMQAIQCYGDLTPVPLYAWEGFSLALGVTDTHTCRNFNSIRRWVDERNMDGTGLDGF